MEHGTVEILDDGTFTYRPDLGFFGTDSFTYVANDGHEDSNVAVVTIEVSDANDAPFFVYEELSTNPDLEGAIQWKAVDGGKTNVEATCGARSMLRADVASDCAAQRRQDQALPLNRSAQPLRARTNHERARDGRESPKVVCVRLRATLQCAHPTSLAR